MKSPHPTTQTLVENKETSLVPIPQRRATDRNPGYWQTLDKALHLLIQQEEWLLGDALAQCNRLLAESREQVEEIKALFEEGD